MARREIRLLGDPVLRRPAEPVPEMDDEIRALMDDMLETMYAADGVGLAAPQVGLSRQVIVLDVRASDTTPIGLANPRIVEQSRELARDEEGCLSLPGLSEVVERSATVTVEGLDRDGELRRIEASGLLARVLQHEIDHINGVLFIDRISPLKRKMLLSRWEKLKAEG